MEMTMAEVVIKFTLPKEQEEYDRCNKALDLCSFIWDFQQYLREQVKYAEKPDDIDTIFEKWFELLDTKNIDLDALYS